MTASTTRPDRQIPDRPAANGAHAHHIGASRAGSVVLDIGDGVGALVVFTGPEWRGREIEISPRDQDPPVRTHVAVRERQVSGGVLYSAVFPALAAGAYVLWRTAAEPAGTVVVAPGTVTELEWWACP